MNACFLPIMSTFTDQIQHFWIKSIVFLNLLVPKLKSLLFDIALNLNIVFRDFRVLLRFSRLKSDIEWHRGRAWPSHWHAACPWQLCARSACNRGVWGNQTPSRSGWSKSGNRRLLLALQVQQRSLTAAAVSSWFWFTVSVPKINFRSSSDGNERMVLIKISILSLTAASVTAASAVREHARSTFDRMVCWCQFRTYNSCAPPVVIKQKFIQDSFTHTQ